MRTYYKAGVWNAICDRCGFEHKSDQLRSEWTGLMVCGPCYETRHPQDLLRVPREQGSVAWSRPSPTDTFVDVSYPINIESSYNEFLQTEAGIILSTEG